ncbi:Ldh family oxidoreductase [Roseomonas sp. SSH11]|uniref:Ldh family oxidoreductase n=1 Tax=Pararoseomonas baculiformis TaxID=2820812 RepID=A0ABS4AJD7_9PROT|nr:Ldh family oxidoreductase [Pararoseomonas baculiformis]MBP0447150.1 Ldh family oxidoreductase [Pararoseomonas baculiformis]
MDDTQHLSLAELGDFITRVLTGLGLGDAHVPAVRDTILAGERDGGGSHGLYRLIMVARTMRLGKVNPHAVPVVRDIAPALVRVEAGGGFAPLAFRTGLPALVEKARANGIAALALNDCAHFAALWPEVEAVAREGLVGLACTPSHAWVAPAGGRKPLFGTNPLAFGWPRPGKDPFVFDFATSASSRGDIELHRRAGKPLPENWGIDAEGNPATSPEAVLAGAMLPFGGHKGSAISAMIELIAGPMIGDMTSAESLAKDEGKGAAPLGGELILAIDPARFQGDRAAGRMQAAEAMFQAITDQGARLPSLRRYAARRRSEAGGVRVSRALLADIEALLA